MEDTDRAAFKAAFDVAAVQELRGPVTVLSDGRVERVLRAAGGESFDFDELVGWWLGVANGDIASSKEKLVEYGGRGPAIDLLETGRDLARLQLRPGDNLLPDDSYLIELAILFYLSSKVNRWLAAVTDGRRPSDDTLKDITYYSMMARRNRAVGGWPVPTSDK